MPTYAVSGVAMGATTVATGAAAHKNAASGVSEGATESRGRTILGILTYVLLTAGFSSILWRIMIQQHSLADPRGRPLVLYLMWCPAAAGLLTRLVFQRTLRGVGWRLPAAKYTWGGYWIPIAYASVVYLPLWAFGLGDFSVVPAAMSRVALQLHLPLSVQSASIGGVLTYVLVVGTVGMIPSCISALGEELGWRGFLVPELAKVTSFANVGLISGVIWAAWHMPLIIGADYHGAGPVWYSILCFAVMVVALGFLAAWLRLRSGSVWPCMLLHASHNLFVQAIFDPLTRHTPFTGYTIGEFGAGLAIVTCVVAYLCWNDRGSLYPGSQNASR
jgi:membrane protease YdiL (CAAX protease family)